MNQDCSRLYMDLTSITLHLGVSDNAKSSLLIDHVCAAHNNPSSKARTSHYECVTGVQNETSLKTLQSLMNSNALVILLVVSGMVALWKTVQDRPREYDSKLTADSLYGQAFSADP